MHSFGIVIACCKTDIHYAKACLHSIRYFLRDVPVCLLVDGPASLCGSIKKHDPHIIVLSNDSLENPWLRKACRGLGHTKMAALWEAPFDVCLYLDADTCVWGDIFSIIPDAGYDLIIDQQKSYSDEEIGFWFFDSQKLAVHFPDFDYGAYRDRYACSGTFFFRRGAMDLRAYQRAWALQQEDSKLFFIGEMGIWNFLVFHGVQKKELRVHSMQFQVIPVDHMEEEMLLEYAPRALQEGKNLKPAVLHFCGKKAHVFTRSVRVATMNHFRLQYLQQIEGLPRWKALWQMVSEDIQYVFWAKGKRGVKKLMRLIKIKL